MRPALVALAVAGLAAAGCSGGGPTASSRPTTSLSSPSTPTTPFATTSPSTLPPTPTAEVLLRAVLADLPSGWELTSPDIWTELGDDSPPKPSGCEDENEFTSARNTGYTTFAESHKIITAEGGVLFISVYTFGAPDDALAFLDRRVSTTNACPSGWDTTVSEEDFDGFASSSHDGAVWTLHSQGSARRSAQAEIDVAETDLSIVGRTTENGVEYGATTVSRARYERHGSTVIEIFLQGTCCSVGFVGADAIHVYSPTWGALASDAGALRPALLRVLEE